MIAFHLDIVPPKATSQSAGKRMMIRNGKPMFFKNKDAKQAQESLIALCQPFAPSQPIEDPVALLVEFTFPWRASEPKWRRQLGRVAHDKRPDCDNLVKMLGDVLTQLKFYRDDAQVAQLTVTKAWGYRPGIRVSISEISRRGSIKRAETQPMLL